MSTLYAISGSNYISIGTSKIAKVFFKCLTIFKSAITITYH